ncbi:MAG: ABC transporter substrate-binding protein [Myxococcota bacterium]
MKPTPRQAQYCGFFALLAIMILAGCTTATPDLRPSLRVGISPNYPPVLFERGGEIVGIEADLARIMADKIGRRLVFHRYSFPELLDALEHGEVDVAMGGLSITPERRERVLFTEPYLKVGQLAVIRAQDIARLGRVRWIKRRGTRVGYERGTSGEDYVANRLPHSAAFAFDSVAEGIRSLRAGRIDYFVHDSPTIWRLAGDPTQRDLIGLYRSLTEEHLAWAVRQDDITLHALLDTTISNWKRDGLIEPILNRWIPFRVRIP